MRPVHVNHRSVRCHRGACGRLFLPPDYGTNQQALRAHPGFSALQEIKGSLTNMVIFKMKNTVAVENVAPALYSFSPQRLSLPHIPLLPSNNLPSSTFCGFPADGPFTRPKAELTMLCDIIVAHVRTVSALGTAEVCQPIYS